MFERQHTNSLSEFQEFPQPLAMLNSINQSTTPVVTTTYLLKIGPQASGPQAQGLNSPPSL